MKEPQPRKRVLTPRGAVLVMLVLGLLFTSVYPLRRYFAVRHEIAALQREERALDAERAELERQVALLKTDEEIERRARDELGMVRPGEVPFIVPRQPDKTEPLPKVSEPDAPAPPRASLLERWWGSVRGALGVLR